MRGKEVGIVLKALQKSQEIDCAQVLFEMAIQLRKLRVVRYGQDKVQRIANYALDNSMRSNLFAAKLLNAVVVKTSRVVCTELSPAQSVNATCRDQFLLHLGKIQLLGACTGTVLEHLTAVSDATPSEALQPFGTPVDNP